ncbi:hypothetical protein O7635_27855 [Asanoa sp. WMMD1127]|uniref:hypothetical protein n=1 Tax=Asanoa sp. WMMD1127 TaxID=3016107 RepID=UPI0024180658|nr:hypothetical protein [Asanoa sp. WMMD1127]MDG4825678.1 hypothetical protein [Asanoa sp. WMMD1127]
MSDRTPPCCVDDPRGQCPQHRQAAKVVGHVGLRTHGPAWRPSGYSRRDVAAGERANQEAAQRRAERADRATPRGTRGTNRGRGPTEGEAMSIRLTDAQYRVALGDVDGRTFTVVAALVSLPVIDDNGVAAWRDFHAGDTATRVPRIFAVAAVNEREIEVSL